MNFLHQTFFKLVVWSYSATRIRHIELFADQCLPPTMQFVPRAPADRSCLTFSYKRDLLQVSPELVRPFRIMIPTVIIYTLRVCWWRTFCQPEQKSSEESESWWSTPRITRTIPGKFRHTKPTTNSPVFRLIINKIISNCVRWKFRDFSTWRNSNAGVRLLQEGGACSD